MMTERQKETWSAVLLTARVVDSYSARGWGLGDEAVPWLWRLDLYWCCITVILCLAFIRSLPCTCARWRLDVLRRQGRPHLPPSLMPVVIRFADCIPLGRWSPRRCP